MFSNCAVLEILTDSCQALFFSTLVKVVSAVAPLPQFFLACTQPPRREPIRRHPEQNHNPHFSSKNLFIKMLRQLATKRIAPVRALSLTRPALVEKPAKSDSFKDREAANENVYVKKHEAEQLKQLKAQLEKQKKAVDKLEKEVENFKK